MIFLLAIPAFAFALAVHYGSVLGVIAAVVVLVYFLYLIDP